MSVWLLAKLNPPQDHIRRAGSRKGLPSTGKSLTEWSESCRGQRGGWGLEHIMDKERLRELGVCEISQSQTLQQGPRQVGGISSNEDFQYLLRQGQEHQI